LFSDNSQTGYLIVAVDNKIVKQDLNNLNSEPETLYEDLDESVLVSGKFPSQTEALTYIEALFNLRISLRC
jgi:hypothetical protein